LKKQSLKKYSSCPLLKKQIKNKYFLCPLFLTATKVAVCRKKSLEKVAYNRRNSLEKVLNMSIIELKHSRGGNCDAET
jgi:hypothetical protein